MSEHDWGWRRNDKFFEQDWEKLAENSSQPLTDLLRACGGLVFSDLNTTSAEVLKEYLEVFQREANFRKGYGSTDFVKKRIAHLENMFGLANYEFSLALHDPNRRAQLSQLRLESFKFGFALKLEDAALLLKTAIARREAMEQPVKPDPSDDEIRDVTRKLFDLDFDLDDDNSQV